MLRIVIFLLLINSWYAAHADDRLEFASYLEAHLANWNSIRQMDVLCRVDGLVEPSVDDGKTATTFERFIFDWDQQKFCFVRFGTVKAFGEIDESAVIEDGFIIADDKFRSLPQAVEEIKQVVNPASGTITFNTFSGKVQAGGHTRFDLKTLMPILSENFVRFDDGPPMITGREHYEWLDIEGIFVPQQVEGLFLERQLKMSPEDIFKITAKMTREQLTPEVVSTLYEDTTGLRDARFHWFSVNRPVNEKFFDFKLAVGRCFTHHLPGQVSSTVTTRDQAKASQEWYKFSLFRTKTLLLI